MSEIKLALDEVRRLTGPNLLSDKPGAIADVFIEHIDPLWVLKIWKKHITRFQARFGWQQEFYLRFFDGGLSVAIPAQMDLLYSACDLLELSWELCIAELHEGDANDYEDILILENALANTIENELNPALVNFIEQAHKNHVRCLVDDDEISLGTGQYAQTWSINAFPNPSEVKWEDFKDIPLALITGTNGKSTSVRLAAEIAKAANLRAGVTSTDFIKVGDEIIDEGDYSGPGGARILLRDKRTEVAYLEVARGGLLRRGLPVTYADASLVTNVASDHLGQYGINTVEEIAEVKLMVAKAIHQGQGRLVLNADDRLLVEYAKSLVKPIVWFSLDEQNPLIQQSIADRRLCVFVSDANLNQGAKENSLVGDSDALTYLCEKTGEKKAIVDIKDIPMTVKGYARHNVQNALGVVGLSKSLGYDDKDIKQGLLNFESSAEDNPGRTNIYDRNGVKIVVDFAHNAHSMQAVIDMVKAMSVDQAFKRIYVLFSHAGDRSDQDIKDVAEAVRELNPDVYVLSELEEYLRGREKNEISEIVVSHLLANGVDASKLVCTPSPYSGAEFVLNNASDGDLALLFILSERERVNQLIQHN
jgi:UDP-N-acetylmuramyl tripeptide synthase